ncbi:MAG: hypothetical protein J5764_04030 [Bacteroidales bacterium]|nr:hypothetical protein [Bacteroidales bacterium]
MKRKDRIFLLTSVFVLIPGTVFPFLSCERNTPEQVPPQKDSLCFRIQLQNELPEDSRADIFIFSDEGIRSLEHHLSCDAAPSMETGYRGDATDKLAVCIINSPFPLNEKAVTRYEILEAMVVRLEDDNPSAPVMSSVKLLVAEEGGVYNAIFKPTPLLCRIRVNSINNNIGSYTRVEDPVLYLQNINSSTEVLRSEGFRPQETGLKSSVLTLPADIGAWTVHPEGWFYCYPNDSRESSVGSPSTEIVVEGHVKGKIQRFRVKIPAFGRGSTIAADIDLGPDGTADASFF